MKPDRDVHCGDIVELRDGWLGVVATVTKIELSPDGERVLKVCVTKSGRGSSVTTWMNYNTFLRKAKLADHDDTLREIEEVYEQSGIFGGQPSKVRRMVKAVRV